MPISRKNELWPRRRAHSESQEFGAKLRIIFLVVCGLGAVPIFPKTELWPRRRACSLSWAAHAFFMRLALLMPASVKCCRSLLNVQTVEFQCFNIHLNTFIKKGYCQAVQDVRGAESTPTEKGTAPLDHQHQHLHLKIHQHHQD